LQYNAIQLLDSELVKPILLENAPQVRQLLLADYPLDYIKADDADDEDSENKLGIPHNSIVKEKLYRI